MVTNNSVDKSLNQEIACVVLNYNDFPTTSSIINKIKEYSIFKYIIVVDNCSTDNSFFQLTNNFKNYDQVKVIRTKRNGGYGYGNNYGIKFAYNKLGVNYAVISNPDVNFSNEMVKKLFRLMINKQASVVSGVQKINDKEINDKAWKVPTAKQWTLVETKLFHKKMWQKYHYDKSSFDRPYSNVECIPGAMYLVNIKDFLAVKGFDEEVFLFGEEVILGWKLNKLNKSVLLVNDQYYNHKHSVSINKTFDSEIEQLKILHNSKMIYYKKYLKLNKLELTLAACIFQLVILRKKLRMIIKGKK